MGDDSGHVLLRWKNHRVRISRVCALARWEMRIRDDYDI